MSGPAAVVVPRDGVNDDVAVIVEWLVADGSTVEAGAIVAVVETTKSAIDVEAPSSGFLFHVADVGTEVPIGDPIAFVSESAERPSVPTAPAAPTVVVATGGPTFTKPAQRRIDELGIDRSAFAHLEVVRESDVDAVAAALGLVDAGDPDDPWRAALDSPLHRDLTALLDALQDRMLQRFGRHVGVGDLLRDRWGKARSMKAGEGTSVYDDVLVLGDVTLGRNCWVGPGAVLDGFHAPLVIGDHVDIGAGTHIYTHNTIERTLTGHKAAVFARPTTIGSCCFIAPQSMVSPGTILGDHTFVATGSYVEGVFASHSYLAGNPATRVGSVELVGDRARIRQDRS